MRTRFLLSVGIWTFLRAAFVPMVAKSGVEIMLKEAKTRFLPEITWYANEISLRSFEHFCYDNYSDISFLRRWLPAINSIVDGRAPRKFTN